MTEAPRCDYTNCKQSCFLAVMMMIVFGFVYCINTMNNLENFFLFHPFVRQFSSLHCLVGIVRRVMISEPDLRLRNDLYCVEWGVKLYSLTHAGL